MIIIGEWNAKVGRSNKYFLPQRKEGGDRIMNERKINPSLEHVCSKDYFAQWIDSWLNMLRIQAESHFECFIMHCFLLYFLWVGNRSFTL